MSSTIDQVLQDAVSSGAVPGVAAIAADRNGVIYEGAAGPRAAGGDEPLTVDTHFRIMSMTKMVATVAALQQVERGTLDLDAPVETYRPEWADVQVLEGFDGDTPRLRPPASRATVKQLVTHTTGLGYWFWNEDVRALGVGHRHAERALRLERDLHGAAGGRPRHEVRVRDQHRLAGQGGRGRRRCRPSTSRSRTASPDRWA